MPPSCRSRNLPSFLPARRGRPYLLGLCLATGSGLVLAAGTADPERDETSPGRELPRLEIRWLGRSPALRRLDRETRTRGRTELERAVHPGGEYHLEVVFAGREELGPLEDATEGRRGTTAPARFRWKIEGGRLHSNDRRRVPWDAPLRVPEQVDGGGLALTCQVELPDGRRLELRERVVLRAAPRRGLVRIPGGEFTIGDTWTDTKLPDFVETNQNQADRPAHRVRLSPYWIGRDRVTNKAYADFLNDLLARGEIEVTPFAAMGWRRGNLVPWFRRSWTDAEDRHPTPRLRRSLRFVDADPAPAAAKSAPGRFEVREGKERHPVVDVTWAGANAFARYHGGRLPTNAEWEFAARGRDGRRYPWGDRLPTRRHANVNQWHGQRLFPVGTFSPLGDSPFGVHEMLGAVFEWVHDWYGETYYRDVATSASGEAAGVVVDPTGPHWGKDHVIRGVPYGHGIVGAQLEQPPLSFRYAWFFEFPVGNGIATRDTGFRMAVPEGARPRRAATQRAPQG